VAGGRIPKAIALATVVGAAALLVLPPPAGLSLQAARAAGVAVLAIGLWATDVVPNHLTAMGVFLLGVLFNVAPPAVIFSGFEAKGFWLIFGGLVLGVAVEHTGLGERLARAITWRFAGSYPALLAGTSALAILMAFLMPSSIGRVALLMPITLALAERVGFGPGSNGRLGMAIILALATTLPGFTVITANTPNLVLAGASENLYGLELTYGSYLLLHFPLLGLLKTALAGVMVWLMFPDRPRPAPEPVVPLGLTSEQKRLALLLTGALALWLTDTLHHVSPAWVALGAALLCLLPGVGLLPTAEFHRRIHVAPLFYVAAILGLGAMVADSGLGELLANRLLAWAGIVPGAAGRNFAVLAAMSGLVSLATTAASPSPRPPACRSIRWS
jgi:di/tricarboxylate transporter